MENYVSLRKLSYGGNFRENIGHFEVLKSEE